MFASLKNKIKEETGSDFSKLTSKITSTTVQRIDSLRGKSHHGSSSSVNSIVSSDGFRENENTDDESMRKRLSKIEADFAKKLEYKEKEWCEIVNSKDKQLHIVEKEKDEAYKIVTNLKAKLKVAEEFKQKLVEHQEDKEQIENFQTQELYKIKHLVLLRDQELADKNSALKEANLQLEKLRGEVTRLRRQEEKLSDVQDDLESLRHTSARDLAALATQLSDYEEKNRHLSDLVVVLRQRVENDTTGEEGVNNERKLLEQRLEETHLHLAEIKTSWSDKITSLETQVGRLSRQAAEEGAERRRAVVEKEQLAEKCQQLEAEVEFNKIEINNKEAKIKRLTLDIEDLSAELKMVQNDSDEEVQFLRTQLQNANTEVKVVKKNLENTENELDKSEDECSKLKISVDSEHQANNSLRQMILKLEKELNDEKSNSLNVQKTLSRVTTEKNASHLRNAELSQQMELVKLEKRRQEEEMEELRKKIQNLEEECKIHSKCKQTEKELKNCITDFEDQIMEKNKNIKTLQLRLADMKKTLQQELRTPGNPNYHSDLMENSHNSVAILTPSQNSIKNYNNHNVKEEDVNFKYLKHVIIKFVTSREFEAQQLMKAISTLLKFTPEEEKLVNETLEWKKSWFGSRPRLHSKNSSS